MANYLDDERVREIFRRFGAGESQRGIARRMGISKATVARYLDGGHRHDDLYPEREAELDRLIEAQRRDMAHDESPAQRRSVAAVRSINYVPEGYDGEPRVSLRHAHLIEWWDPTADAAIGVTSVELEAIPDGGRGEVREPPKHNATTYQNGCRCDQCRTAQREAMRAYREKWRGRHE